ncbi:radical SAM/SPASM domain-containing protein [Castellaniella sp.]|uniref:radical SAM/SPASM domain-containing protein n=1 Tax=Castellaniella sp. TaxID=1955812 RepID=UPI002AFE2D40|nr:radical SAM protein [Castellaniella sp.]
MRFTLQTKHAKTGREKTFVYDNMAGTLHYENGARVPVASIEDRRFNRDSKATVFDHDSPVGKTANVQVLKIQLGLSCNYSCDYCSQRFVPRADETSRKQVQPFLDSLSKWMVGTPQRIEFWGGEPLVYIKTLVPLAEALREQFPNTTFLMITNGSLLTPEINEWLDRTGFNVGVSHDGPGQFVRGPDPFDDPKKKEAILDLYKRLRPQGRMSFNSMVSRSNLDRAAIQQFFVDLTGDPEVPIGEGSFIDVYDEGGAQTSMKQTEEKAQFRKMTLDQLQADAIDNFSITRTRLDEWADSMAYARPAEVLGQKCGMDRPGHIAVDLNGNILTCQNVSIVSFAPNGEGHKIGHVDDIEHAALDTARHWATRQECLECPVLQLCKGACMFLEGDYFYLSCENAYSDHVPFFARAVELATGGYVPYRIESPTLPEHRKNLFEVTEAKPGAPRVVPRVLG